MSGSQFHEPLGSCEHPESWIGAVLDRRYRLIEVVGTGAMGSVFRAEHVTTRRRFAIKLLHAELASNYETRKRFEREAVAIGRIQHPNCVDVSDFGELDDGSLYLAMEFLEGRSLADVIEDEGALEPVRALRIIRDLVRGLGHAHAAGIVHRDVKPGNVFLVQKPGESEVAKLVDFGIAKLIGEEGDQAAQRLTAAGMAFGTPLYISPEQATGGRVDGRSDLYSATAVLFEMLTGHPPFEAEDNLGLLTMQATHPPPRLVEMAPETRWSDALEALVARGLTKRPRERFADAAEYASAVTEAMDGLGPGERDARVRSVKPKDQTVPLVYGTPADTAGAAASMAVPSLRPQKNRLWLAIPVLAAIAAVLLVSYWRRMDAASLSPAELESSVARLLEDDEVDAAAALVEAHRELVAEQPEGQIAMGRVHAAAGRGKAALEAFRTAYELDRGSADHPGFRSGLRRLLAAERPAIARAAASLAVGQLGDRKAEERLVGLASGSEQYRVRRRSFALAEEYGLGDRIDRLRSYTLDLEHRAMDYHCRHRRRAVGKLRELGDPRAIPELIDAIRRQDARGEPVNECLIDEARAAIEELRSRPGEPRPQGG